MSRIENRTTAKRISIRQSGFDDEAWINLEPHSTTNFAWENPYGLNCVDAKVDERNGAGVWKLDFETVGLCAAENEELGLQFHIVDIGNTKVAWFTDRRIPGSTSEEIRCFPLTGNWEHSYNQTKTQNDTSPVELIVELGVIGVSIIDHKPRELSYFYLERVFMSYSTGYDGGSTSR